MGFSLRWKIAWKARDTKFKANLRASGRYCISFVAENHFGTKHIYQTASTKQCNKYWAWPMAKSLRARGFFPVTKWSPEHAIHSSIYVYSLGAWCCLNALTHRSIQSKLLPVEIFVEMSIWFEVFAFVVFFSHKLKKFCAVSRSKGRERCWRSQRRQ